MPSKESAGAAEAHTWSNDEHLNENQEKKKRARAGPSCVSNAMASNLIAMASNLIASKYSVESQILQRFESI